MKEESLYKSKRGVVNEPRNVAIYLARILRNDGLAEICRDYGLKKYSSAGSVIERVNGQRSRARKFKGRIDKIISMTIKRHPVTPMSMYSPKFVLPVTAYLPPSAIITSLLLIISSQWLITSFAAKSLP